MTSPSSVLPPGLADSFEAVRPLGAGGMGAVWLVRDRFLDRLVALKVLQGQQHDADMRERFLREARTSARLEHPHIIDVYRADETDGVVWFTMRYINGESLGDRLRDRGRCDLTECLRILREVSWGLAYAHARGVVHRDIKPDNILLDRDSGRTVLTDFGIARDMAYASSLTLAGNVLGSVHYMSPEQAAGEPVDGRSDIYALGCVAYHMLAGVPPFEGPAHAVLVAHVTRPAPLLGGVAPQAPEALAALVDACLRKAPEERPASADHLASAFDSLLREVESTAQARADAAPGGVLSESEARLVWQRAAQLQAEAAHRMERRAVLDGARVSSPETDEPVPSDSYRLRDVEAAAVEAGISRQYVAIALAELRAGDGSRALVTEVSDREDRRMTLLMGTADRAVSVSRVIPASPKAVLQAMGAVFTAPPHDLVLQDTINGHPLDGGIMRFKVPRLTTSKDRLQAFRPEKRLLYRLEQIELFDLNVTLQARGTPATPACEVVITGDLREGLRRNIRFDLALMGIASTVGFAGTVAGLSSMLGVAAGSAAPLLAASGVSVLAGALEGVWYRWLFRSALGGAMGELEQLLQQIERHLAQRALFSGE